MPTTVPRQRRATVSLAEARRIALASQGFAEPRPARGKVDGRTLNRVLKRVGMFQIDSVNVLVRAHYMPLFSRAGAYDMGVIDRAAARAPRRLFEYWAHEASLLPVATQPLHRWHMDIAAHAAWGGMRRVAEEQPELVERVYEEVAARGPVAAREIEHARRPEGRSGPWWDWSDGKRALEFLFWSGRITCARRGPNFERLYDLPERVLPREIFDAPTPPRDEAQRELVRIAARAMGVATERDLRQYFRLGVEDARARVAELVESGELLPVAVESWAQEGYLWHETRVPRAIDARALVAPFDPLVWERDRVERVFGFRYRLEIYTPKPKRIYGYYVLPFLLGDRLVARVDLKADRAASCLRVLATHLEPDAPPETQDALAAELDELAYFIGVESCDHGGHAARP